MTYSAPRMLSSAFSRLVSLSRSSVSELSPSRSQRNLTCEQLSSAERYKTVCSLDRCAATCVKRVDLPMPGSPPTRTSEPRTMPPPSTTSSSAMPEETRSYFSYLTCERGRAREIAVRMVCFLEEGRAGAIGSSTSVLNFPQSGQRPSHLGEVYPHSAHTNCVVAFGIIFRSCFIV